VYKAYNFNKMLTNFDINYFTVATAYAIYKLKSQIPTSYTGLVSNKFVYIV